RTEKARSVLINLQRRPPEDQHHDASKQPDVRPTRKPSSARSRLAQAFTKQTSQARLQLGPNLGQISGDECAHSNRNALSPKSEPPPNAVNKNRNGDHRQPVEKHNRAVRYVSESFASRSHRSVHDLERDHLAFLVEAN